MTWYTSNKTIWGTEHKKNFNGGYKFIRTQSIPALGLNLGLSVASAGIMYMIGDFCGDFAEHIPYINSYVPAAIDWATNIDVAGNLGGLGGLLGGLSGFVHGGIELTDDRQLEKVTLSPMTFTVRTD